ncbi:MAG TPA: filamin/ABP280 repeat domain-containing protein, partial [Gemmatimonadales bacterium]|nr:filamin/ABP280 repeat domain-containing protein [Gemmatimonadales bacterium]
MLNQITQGMRELEFLSRLARATNRRTFLQWSGMTIAVATAACGDDEGEDITSPAGRVDPAQSTASVPTTAPPGELLSITVISRDADGNPLAEGGLTVVVEATGANATGALTATDNGDGTYTVSYLPRQAGTDTVAITIEDQPISGSPFTITIAVPDTGTSFGAGDTGILNYAFALEQLEAAFYSAVVATPYAGITPEETQILTEIRDHEVIHREFLRAALADERSRTSPSTSPASISPAGTRCSRPRDPSRTWASPPTTGRASSSTARTSSRSPERSSR